jgi:hypothetical protein
MFHVQGACRILELRGPPSKESPLNLSLFSRVRITAVSLAMKTLKNTARQTTVVKYWDLLT